MPEDKNEEEGIGIPKPIIIQIDPNSVEASLFKGMGYQTDAEETVDVRFELEGLKGIPSRVGIMLEFLTKNYLRTVLGGQIISPTMGKDIIIDRIIQFSEMLLSVYEDNVAKFIKKINEKRITGEDFEEELREILEYIDTYFIVIREVMNRLLTVLHINSPPQVRPPLANIKIGYDKIDPVFMD